MGVEAAIERAQEWPSLPFEMLPGVLTIENDEDGRLSSVGARGVPRAGISEPLDEVVRRSVGGPRRVAEANQVGQRMIPEAARDLPSFLANAIRAIQRLG